MDQTDTLRLLGHCISVEQGEWVILLGSPLDLQGIQPRQLSNSDGVFARETCVTC